MSEKKLTITCNCGKIIHITSDLRQLTQIIEEHAKTHKPQEVDKTINLLTAQILNKVAALP